MRFIEKILPPLIKRYLALDPESTQRLQKLNNKVVEIQLNTQMIQLHCTETGILVKTNSFLKPDTIIKSTPISLLHMAFQPKKRFLFLGKTVSVTGNMDVGQQLMDLFDTLEIDWEEHLSHYTGDIPAHLLTKASQKIGRFVSRLTSTLAQNTNEYVHEEANVFPSKEELNDFYNDVDALQMDVDRLELSLSSVIPAPYFVIPAPYFVIPAPYFVIPAKAGTHSAKSSQDATLAHKQAPTPQEKATHRMGPRLRGDDRKSGDSA